METYQTCDVAVVGGGPGGVAAAVAAARAGARTLLLEREGCLGGGATTLFVQPFMTHETTAGPNGQPRKVVNAGIFKEICDRLAARGAQHYVTWGIHFDDEVLRVVLDELTADAGVEVIFHAALFDVECDGSRAAAATFAHNSAPLRVEAKVFVDSTGDSLLASRAGCECVYGDGAGRAQPMTLNFMVAGVDTEKMDHAGMYGLVKKGGSDAPPLINANLSCHTVPHPGMVHFNGIRVPLETLDPRAVSDAEIDGRRRVDNFVQWLRAKVPCFENCFLVKTGAHIGIRENRHVMGDYVLIADDFRRGATFDDGIACCAYDVDIHPPQPGGAIFEHLPPGGYYQIPYRCLTPRGVENLLIASRGISADYVAHGSFRVMPPVMCIGQAAGIAAAMALPAGHIREIDVQELRQRIRDAGGVLEP